MPRKRSHTEMETPEPPPERKEMSLLHRIRNMWEFASMMQYIFMFGKAVKIDEDFDIEVCTSSAQCLRCMPVPCGGVCPMDGIANLLYAGLRDSMSAAWSFGKAGRNR